MIIVHKTNVYAIRFNCLDQLYNPLVKKSTDFNVVN